MWYSSDESTAIPSVQHCEKTDQTTCSIQFCLPGSYYQCLAPRCYWQMVFLRKADCTFTVHPLTLRAQLLWRLPQDSGIVCVCVCVLQGLQKKPGLKDRPSQGDWTKDIMMPPAAYSQLNPGLVLPIWWLCALRHSQKGDAWAHHGDLLDHTHLLYFSAELQCWKHSGIPWNTN